MKEQRRYPKEAFFPLMAGVLWLGAGTHSTGIGLLLSLVPGILLLASGTAQLLWPGDRRITHAMALGAVVGIVMGLPQLLFLRFSPDLLFLSLTVVLGLIALSAASLVASGSATVNQAHAFEDVPVVERSFSLSAQVGVDNAILSGLLFMDASPTAKELDVIIQETEEAKAFFEAKGWRKDPASYHTAPPPLTHPVLVPKRSLGLDFEHMTFESEYAPCDGEPGRDRWLAYGPGRKAHAWVLRHPGPPRPWLVLIHGYQMGHPGLDFLAFQTRYFYETLGLNVVHPVLPLHGPRKISWISGDGYLSGNLMDSIHAEGQAMWDIRRILSWIRDQGTPTIGVYGLSLGGYNTALLASLDGGLACAVAGIPAVDMSQLFWHHGPPLLIQYLASVGYSREQVAELLKVVAPLVLEPRIPLENRFIFAGVADQQVTPDQVRDFWVHWGKPRIHWFQGSHITFRLDPRVMELTVQTLRESGVFT